LRDQHQAAVDQSSKIATACEAAVKASLSTLPYFTRYSKTESIRLPEEEPAVNYLRKLFVASVTRHRKRQGAPHSAKPDVEVTRVERIVNPRQQEKYLAELQDMEGLCQLRVTPLHSRLVRDGSGAVAVQSIAGRELNEFLLYHGIPSELVERLKQQGLDPRRAGSNFGKLYGSAVYLAANSSKSDIYTEPNAAGERCVLVVRACLGEAHLAKQAMQSALMPPERPDGRGPLNSVAALTHQQGGVVEHPEYMVYASSQCLPMFAIWYKHHANCGCTHCC